MIHFFRPKQPSRIFNTWFGDPGKIFLLEAVLNVIRKDNLLAQASKTGESLKKNLMSMQKQYSSLINSVRGRGLFLAYNASCPKLRDDIIKKLKNKGK